MGDAAESVIGFYSMHTNAITTYDLTGTAKWNGSRRSPSGRRISELLSRPEAERTVATVIHEATHQLAFNSNLQTRFADIPVWLSEGLAIYFETPDLASRKGWRTIGAVNRYRHAQMMKYLAIRPSGSLKSLLADNQRFRNTRTAEAAYAESWALCFFLMKTYPKEFNAYMQRLRKKTPLGEDDPDVKLREFQEAFQVDFDTLDARFVRFVSQLR